MTEKEFSDLLQRYLEGEVTPDEKESVEKWYSLITSMPERCLTEGEMRKIREEYRMAIVSRLQRRKTVSVRRTLAVAASVSIFVFLFFHLKPLDRWQIQGRKNPIPLQVNTGTAMRHIVLPDGSKVLLFPGSKLDFASDFPPAVREVYLEGKAFFDVAHNPEKPFYVFTSDVVTKVLGTSFSVQAFPGDADIEIAVTTGKVSVFRKEDAGASMSAEKAIMLTPNQQAIYSRKDDTVFKKLVADPRPVLPRGDAGRMIRFENTSAADIFRALEKIYGVEIVFDDAAFRDCLLTTSGSQQTLYEFIDIICEAIGATYTIVDAEVRISGKGCRQ